MFLLVMGPDQKFWTWVGPDQFFCSSSQVGSAIYVLGLDLENFPLKCQIFNYFPFESKNLFGSGQKVPKSKVWSGRVRAHL